MVLLLHSVFVLVEDKKFYQGKENNNEIYHYFRQGKPIQGLIQKPTGAKDEEVQIERIHHIHWHELMDSYRYYVLKIS